MTCLKDTWTWLSQKENKENYTIIHAIVERPSDGLRHPHAVIYNKITGNIHEVSNIFKKNNVILPFKFWIIAGKVSNIKQYDFYELNEKLLKFKKWNFYHIKKE